jgi:hypothetical protein
MRLSKRARWQRFFPRRLARGLLILRPFRQTIELLFALQFASRKVRRQLTNKWRTCIRPTFQAAWVFRVRVHFDAQLHPGQLIEPEGSARISTLAVQPIQVE